MSKRIAVPVLLLAAAGCSRDLVQHGPADSGVTSGLDAGERPDADSGPTSCTCIDPRPAIAQATCGNTTIAYGCAESSLTTGGADFDPRCWFITPPDPVTGCEGVEYRHGCMSPPICLPPPDAGAQDAGERP